MKKFTLVLLIIISAGIGYYAAYIQNSLQKTSWSEVVITKEITLLEKFKSDIPCSLLEKSKGQMTIQKHSNGLIIWRYIEGGETIKKLVIDKDFNTAEDSLVNTCHLWQ